MKSELKVGDVVTLQSGGPNLVVSQSYGSGLEVQVTWFAGGEIRRAVVPQEALKRG